MDYKNKLEFGDNKCVRLHQLGSECVECCAYISSHRPFYAKGNAIKMSLKCSQTHERILYVKREKRISSDDDAFSSHAKVFFSVSNDAFRFKIIMSNSHFENHM